MRVNYKFCPLYLHHFAGGVLWCKSLRAVSITFQNLASYHRFRGEIESSDSECESIVPHLNLVSSPINELRMLRLNGSFNPDFDSKAGLDIVKSGGSKRWSLLKGRTTFYNS
ncbi:hypothetical protein Hanom_Chr12g01096641 [Helianthus anomalus]